LPQVVGADTASCCFTNLLDRRQKHSNKDADDRDHDQKLDEGKPIADRVVTSAW
jgi:hypothetical protein